MRILLTLFCFMNSSAVLAGTMLCIVDAAAVVEDGNNQPATASVARLEMDKFIITSVNGSRVVKAFGNDQILFNECNSAYCQHSRGYIGTFILHNLPRFSVVLSLGEGQLHQLAVAKGQCDSL